MTIRPFLKPELLVPAGGGEPFAAAVENGADAVYLGGKAFNARMNAGNFDDHALRAALRYAHARGVRVHVTLNTLLHDDELAPAVRYADFLAAEGVDAVIVQDLGLARLLRRYVPDLPLHLSTQATAWNARAVEEALRMGFSRVVLARELSLPEIRSIYEETGAELEVFVHGALCFCWSGQCQLSRAFGGRSGNRGVCAQPCRLAYQVFGTDGRPVKGAPAYPLSPKDLCLLPDLGELISAGVCSFKVEGRMKSPEYVAVVTRIYRKYIDQYLTEGRVTPAEEDQAELLQIFNRGGFTEGYLHGAPGRALFSGDLPKHRGVRVGRLVRTLPDRPELAEVRLDHPETRPLEQGDGFEIHGREPVGNILTYWKPLRNGNVLIGDLPGVKKRSRGQAAEVRPGDSLWRTSSSRQLKAAERSYQGVFKGPEGTFSAAGKRKRKIGIQARELADGRLLLSALPEAAGDGSPARAEVVTEAFPADPEGRSVRERAVQALGKTGGTPFEAAEIQVEGELKRRIPMKALNGARRELLARLEEEIVQSGRRPQLTGGDLPGSLEGAGAPARGEVTGVSAGRDPLAGLEREVQAAAAEARAAEAARPRAAVFLSWADFQRTWMDFQRTGIPPEFRQGAEEHRTAGDRAAGGLAAGNRASFHILLPFQELADHLEEVREWEEREASGWEPAQAGAGSPEFERAGRRNAGRAAFVPYVSAVPEGKEDRWLRDHWAEASAIARDRGVSVGTLGWVRPFLDAGCRVTGGSGLNLFNGEALRQVRELGLAGGMPSLETLDRQAGGYPLMITASDPAGARLTGFGDRRLDILRSGWSDQRILRRAGAPAYYLL